MVTGTFKYLLASFNDCRKRINNDKIQLDDDQLGNEFALNLMIEKALDENGKKIISRWTSCHFKKRN